MKRYERERSFSEGHKLLFMEAMGDVDERLNAITLEQPFVPNFAKKAAVGKKKTIICLKI